MTINPNHVLLKDALTTYRRALFVTFMFSILVNILVLAGPLYMLQVFDRVLTSRSTDTLLLITLICVIALLTMALIEMVRSRITVILSAWIDRTLSPALFEGSVYKALNSSASPSTQSLRDIRAMRGFISGPQLFTFFDAPWAPLFILVMFGLHPNLGLVALGGAILLFALAVLNELLTRHSSAEDGGASIAAMTIADATVRNADAVSAMGMMPAMKMRWSEATARSRASQIVSEKRTSVILAVSKFTRMALQMMILGTGAWLAVAGEITAGVMIAGSILMSRALAPVEQAIGGWRAMLGAKQSYRRVREQLLTQPVTPESMELPSPVGNVTVSGLSFMVDGAREPVLRNVSFSLNAGESLALIGPSGSGKSTLARLLLGNLSPRTGHVRLDGMDVSSWSPDQLGPHCGYLPQDVELFSGTVKDNISRMAEADPIKVVVAAQMAGCHELILALPEGYDTQIGDRGNSLSGGTKQRIGLARALYDQPRFVVLDEPNSNLDGQGEAALATALSAMKDSGTTVVIIGHRQSTLEHVDKVLMISDGTVQAYGTKQEVSQQLGLVAPLKAAPFKKENSSPLRNNVPTKISAQEGGLNGNGGENTVTSQEEHRTKEAVAEQLSTNHSDSGRSLNSESSKERVSESAGREENTPLKNEPYRENDTSERQSGNVKKLDTDNHSDELELNKDAECVTDMFDIEQKSVERIQNPADGVAQPSPKVADVLNMSPARKMQKKNKVKQRKLMDESFDINLDESKLADTNADIVHSPSAKFGTPSD